MIRSTWDYIDDLVGFFEVLGQITQAGCRLINPLATIEWNHDKRYLARLAADKLQVVPSVFISPGGTADDALATLGPAPQGYICKPTVGVGGFGTRRAQDATVLRRQVAEGNADWQVVQPFLPAIETEGEFSFVFGAGQFLYAAQKVPAAGDFRVQVMYGAATRQVDPAPTDLAAAWQCHDALPVEAHLARIDMVRSPNGALVLMEAELIEPQLYFHDLPDAASLVAGAIAEALA